jgi:hypothetical protein
MIPNRYYKTQVYISAEESLLKVGSNATVYHSLFLSILNQNFISILAGTISPTYFLKRRRRKKPS